MDFINVARILRSKEIIDRRPDFVEQDDILIVIYTFTQSIRSNIFNYHVPVKDLNITYFVENSKTVPYACSKFIPKYIDKNHQHILAGDLGLISNAKLKKKMFPKALNTENLLIYPGKKPKHKLSLV